MRVSSCRFQMRGKTLTKVIVFNYLLERDPEFLLDDERFKWAERHMVRGRMKNQVVALIKGDEIPQEIFVNGAGKRRIQPYVEEPSFCLRCSRWGHRSWQCQEDPICRYCGKTPDSKVCGDKFKPGARVPPQCCNCDGQHNARLTLCARRPHTWREDVTRKRKAGNWVTTWCKIAAWVVKSRHGQQQDPG